MKTPYACDHAGFAHHLVGDVRVSFTCECGEHIIINDPAWMNDDDPRTHCTCGKVWGLGMTTYSNYGVLVKVVRAG